jgi:hypothetical protein
MKCLTRRVMPHKALQRPAVIHPPGVATFLIYTVALRIEKVRAVIWLR